MCLLFVYTNPDPDDDEFSMVLVNVRDEFFHRPTKPASFWEDDPHIVGGRDQEKGREGGHVDGRRGRGFLVVDFIKSTMDGNAYLTKLMKEKDEFNGFLFVAIEAKPLKKKISMSYYSNLQEGGPVQTEPGFHAFGNSVPPTVLGQSQDQLLEKIYDFLDESTSYPVDDAMRKQSQEPESTLRLMNQMKYILPNYNYGTRTHSILFVNGAGKAEFIEKTMKEPIDITSKIVWETKELHL
ncbi:hypothetical protein MTO96_019794 [Rhipicephalus appendiculatus]